MYTMNLCPLAAFKVQKNAVKIYTNETVVFLVFMQ